MDPTCASSSSNHDLTSLYDSYVISHTRETPRTKVKVDYVVRRFVPSNRDARLLDLGCGSGRFLRGLRDEGYTNLEGIDHSAQQVALATHHGVDGVRQGDAREYLREGAERFDVVTANDFLEHLPRDQVVEVFREVFNSLKPGGLFLAQTPNGASPFFGRYLYGDFTHFCAFTDASIRQICTLIGFDNVRVVPVPPHVRNVKGAARRTLWELSTLPLKVAIAAESGQIRGHILTTNLAFSAQKALSGR